MNELIKLSARAAVDGLEAGEIRPSELVAASIQRIEEVDGPLNAMVTRCFERAQDHAQRIERNEAPAGPLRGLPVGIKDQVQVAGVRSTEGSPIFAERIPERSDLMVENLENNGAIVMGKTNVPEFSAGANTFNEIFGATRNPWDTRMTCGGSSGGTAVALASGQVWLATGSDLGGSIRIPAAFCSVVGLRPSPGRVATGPRALPYWDLGVHGPLARNVGDTGLFLDAMVGHNQHDPLSLEAPSYRFRDAAENPRAPKRVAWSATLGIAPVDPEVAAVCQAAVDRLTSMGVAVEETHPDFSEARQTFQTYRAVNFSTGKKALLDNYRDQIKPDVIWNINKGLETPIAEFAEAERARGRLYNNLADFFDDFDLLITPTVMAPPFDVDIPYLTEVAGVKFDNYVDWLMHTYVITLTTCPAISIPCGFTASGLPVGLQLVAPARTEANLLSYAAALEAELGLAALVPLTMQDLAAKNLAANGASPAPSQAS